MKDLDANALLPTQRRVLERLERLSAVDPLVNLHGAAGAGKTTILRAFCRKHGARYIGMAESLVALCRGSPLQGTAAHLDLMSRSFGTHETVVFDAMALAGVATALRGDDRLSTTALHAMVRDRGKRLIISSRSAWQGFRPVRLDAYTSEDYGQFLINRLGAAAVAPIDARRLHRFAPALSLHDLNKLCDVLAAHGFATTEDVLRALATQVLISNTRTAEVEQIPFDALPGAEQIFAKLQTHVLLPLEQTRLAQALDLRPKRGVLLYGPPGTGKTSIGRALAHRMKGKFFLIDGTATTEPPASFFSKVEAIVAEAKANAPCVLFIDDADVLFGIVHISGFSRYLLTLLDGMESDAASRVCVIMTAMDARKVPGPLLRSGRVELWLETRLPDVSTRAAILRKWVGIALPEHDTIDYRAIAESADRFTPADLRRVCGDALAYFATDQRAARQLRTGQVYLERAVAELTATRRRMAEQLRDDSLRIGAASQRDKYGTGIGGLVEAATSCDLKGW